MGLQLLAILFREALKEKTQNPNRTFAQQGGVIRIFAVPNEQFGTYLKYSEYYYT